jgi:hypothetical protein
MTKKLIFRKHAVQRMFQRSIAVEDVRAVLAKGNTIIDYPDNQPYPSRLMLGWRGTRPIHVVAANTEDGETILITVYEPDPELWEPGFERKKP